MSGNVMLMLGLIAMFAVVAMAQTAGEGASGTLHMAKESFTLKHAFAVMDADPFSDGKKENLVVMLSDVPVPQELQKAGNGWRIWASEQAQEGKIHGVIAIINPETKVWDSGQVITKQGFMFYTESVSGDAERDLNFAAAGAIGATAAGRFSMKKEMHGMSDEDAWKVDAEFHCAVARPAAVTAQLTGEEARNSPQYKAAHAFFEACAKKDLAGIREAADPQSRDALMKMFEGPNKDEALNMFQQMAAQAITFTVKKVTVRGDSAEVELVDPKDANSSQTLRLVLAGGAWKMAQ